MAITSQLHQQQHGQCRMKKYGKITLTVALTVLSTCFIASESFQPVMVVSSSIDGKRSSSSSSSQLNYVVYGEDQVAGGNKGIETSKKNKKAPVKTIKPNKNAENCNHGYVVSNHDNERSFWLHALQNLEPSSTSPTNNQSLWTRIAHAYAPTEISSAAARIQSQQDATVVRVGDADLDIAVPVPSDSWDPSTLEEENVISATKASRSNHHLVTVRVQFPEGSSFDTNARSFEDELIAVIDQVRLLEQTANERLSKL